jgi:amidohydrolase
MEKALFTICKVKCFINFIYYHNHKYYAIYHHFCCRNRYVMIERIKAESFALRNYLIDIRRYLHQHPELSFYETNTANYICKQLDRHGIVYKKEVGGHGIVALIEGLHPTKNVFAIRGDMDALPIEELNNVPYKSCNAGVMHACGHDVHTTCVLGAAILLNMFKQEWEGTVKVIFQPAEERLPGGASIMIKEGVLENPSVTGICGQHVLPQLEVGKVSFRSGLSMASCDEIFITVTGKGGHGAVPQLAVDTVLVASHIVVALQQIVSRNANPTMPTVLTIGKFIAEGATNVIPEKVYLEGTLRTFDEHWRSIAKDKINTLVTTIAESMGAHADCRIEHGYPYLNNDAHLTEIAENAAIAYLGKDNVMPLDIRMTAEDFSYYSQIIPACFYRLGTGNQSKGIISGIHTPTFDVDEDCLEIGAGLMCWIAMSSLQA